MNDDKIRAGLRSAWDSYHLHNDMLPGSPCDIAMANMVGRFHTMLAHNPDMSLNSLCLDVVFWLHRMDDFNKEADNG